MNTTLHPPSASTAAPVEGVGRAREVAARDHKLGAEELLDAPAHGQRRRRRRWQRRVAALAVLRVAHL